MGFTEQKLKYTIDVDSGRATTELSSFDKALAGVRSNAGGLGIALSDFAGPAAVAAGAIAGIGTAALAAGEALFTLTMHASDFGSAIHDASDKTGLHAETLSTLDLVAKQSGSSLDQITGSIAKFAKTVGQASDGSKEAAKNLTDLGVTPQDAINDLDGTLEKVFKKIYDAKPGIEQITLAQKAFGKSGADLIPVINQMGGALGKTKKEFEAMGLTISDQDARAADDFGDQMTLLQAQIEMVGIKIGQKFMPVFMQMANSVSGWVVKNQSEISTWADKFAFLVTAEVEGWTAIIKKVEEYWGWLEKVSPLAKALGFIFNAGASVFNNQYDQYKKEQGRHGTEGSGGTGYIYIPDDPTKPGGKPKAGGSKANPEQLERDRIQNLEQTLQREIQLKGAANDIILNRLQSDLDMGIVSEKFAVDARQQMTRDFMVFRMEQLDKELAAVQGNTEAEKQARGRLLNEKKVQEATYEAELEKQRGEAFKAAESDLDKQIELWKAQGKAIDENIRKVHSYLDTLANPTFAQGPKEPAQKAGAGDGTGFLDQLYNATGRIQTMDDVLGQLGNTATGVFMQMGQGLGAMVDSWVMLGNQSDVSMKKMVAAVLGGVAAQAATLAIFHLAMGIAALTPWGAAMYGPAPLHFKAAAIWGAIAVGAALAGRAAAGGSGKKAGGGASAGGGYGGGSGSSSSNNINQNPSPYSRVTPDAYISGDRPARFVAQAIERHTAALEKIHAKIDSMPAGDVLTRGMKERPGVVADQVHKDIRSDAGKGMKIGSAMGLR
jgi:hypothetical protein